ncbi:MAG: hypothetical protein A2722_01775 [Candidatus Doudnabacteria bacterium RIFCSPHIGHO2_01_FULL_50_11]|uniref:Phosphoribosyltransferase domain-containing protein n=1 Tax=Candidatus Doudnabacteria bacterium RIFCSPHIGHO2_01_FULL_50_11 TaxID=1817828 RepID=A0A1F5PND6_9BACT|nr:MAG: hypothetical protein A2722_01775 [Candidatus Doudnabacteria bacterium RIFCSPHIGHO2_01_FULL_50_11]HLC44679.1 hypothetical protein [Patescibacteria group bacterium]
MQTPSGAVYTHDDLELLKEMATSHFITLSDKPYLLNSGIESRFYVHGRQDLTDHPRLVWMVGEKIATLIAKQTLRADGQPCLIGIPTVGNSFAQAASMVAFREGIEMPNGKRLCYRVMREVRKDHGPHRGWVNGEPDSGQTYWLVDNTLTDGKSKLAATAKLRQDKYPCGSDHPDTYPCLIWIDRQQGGLEKLKAAGFTRLVVAYNLLDVVYAYAELRLWARKSVRMVAEEIRQHKLLGK